MITARSALSACKQGRYSFIFVKENTDTLKYTTKNTIRFFVLGDWGRAGNEGQQLVADQMAHQAELLQPDFIISTGDNFYDNGVDGPEDPLWQSAFEQVYHHSALQIPWYCVLGNHDYGGNTLAQINYGTQSERWHMPSRFYGKCLQNGSLSADFIFTDTTPLIQEYQESDSHPDILKQRSEVQLRWLRRRLAHCETQWKIVIGHHPVYSSSPMHGDTEELLHDFEPLFRKYEVDAYLCGHEHDLQLQQPEGETYYVVSGAGSEIRETDRKEITTFSASAHGFACITLDGQQMQIQFIDEQGATLYTTRKARLVQQQS
ncbi:MAG: purple acid phosphatase family protein [Cyclobacteriaceae bacterium]